MTNSFSQRIRYAAKSRNSSPTSPCKAEEKKHDLPCQFLTVLVQSVDGNGTSSISCIKIIKQLYATPPKRLELVVGNVSGRLETFLWSACALSRIITLLLFAMWERLSCCDSSGIKNDIAFWCSRYTMFVEKLSFRMPSVRVLASSWAHIASSENTFSGYSTSSLLHVSVSVDTER